MSLAQAPHLWFYLVPQPLGLLHCLVPEAAVIYCFSFSVPAEPGFPPFQEVNQVPASPLPQLFSEYLLWLFISFHLPGCECYVVLENKTQIGNCTREGPGKGCERDGRGQFCSVCVWRQRSNITLIVKFVLLQQRSESCCLLCPLQDRCGNSSHGNISNFLGVLAGAPYSLSFGH